MKGLVGASLILLFTQASSLAAETYEGIWAKSNQECLDEEGPNSRTLIDLANRIDGKPSPLFDQYENHCRINQNITVPDGAVLIATCFEFWENFTKGTEGSRENIALSIIDKNTIRINGYRYQRCTVKATGGKKITDQKNSGSVSDTLLPNAELALISTVENARDAYAAGANDMAKGSARPARAKGLCSLMKSPVAKDWIGELATLSSNSDGWGVLAVKINSNIVLKTWNNAVSDAADKTLIDPNSPVFKKAAVLRTGQRVKFSGQFIRDQTDCFREGSLTLKGSLTQPEYIFRFSDIELLD
ncbi:hypothetical protein NML43_06130 [Rhodopseudomonas palustris]|uniref:hypothetical protein n=1 Tax=Rhodopseudomonas palustris TaxID=1076 RepID=UPI0020CE4884|nr:hypothetical protein [Rhodopseudomonas palustris]MCP9626660.1 hypothetical protein [Rhodopseudomonas palustris]